MLSFSLSISLQPEGGTGGDAVAVLGAAVEQLLQQGPRLSVGAEPSPGAAVTGVKLGRGQADGAVRGPGSRPARRSPAFPPPGAAMGKHSSKLAPEMLDDLVRSTEFSEQELKQWYKGFLKDCPTGILNLEEFQQLYIKVGLGWGLRAAGGAGAP